MKVQSAKVSTENSFQVYMKTYPRLKAGAELSWISLQTDLRWPHRFLIGIDGSCAIKLEKRAGQGSSSESVLPLHPGVLRAAVQRGTEEEEWLEISS